MRLVEKWSSKNKVEKLKLKKLSNILSCEKTFEVEKHQMKFEKFAQVGKLDVKLETVAHVGKIGSY